MSLMILKKCKKALRPKVIHSLSARSVFALCLACSSLVYEFAFANILINLMGGTLRSYTLTVALFTFFLGMGSMFYDKAQVKWPHRSLFFLIELSVCLVALFGPFILLSLDASLFVFGTRLDVILNLLMISLVGFLTGVELPLLLKGENENIVLSFDYMGMFLGVILFPFVFIEQLGVIATCMFFGFFNLFFSFLILKKSFTRKILILLAISGGTFVVIFNNEINELSSKLFLGKYV